MTFLEVLKLEELVIFNKETTYWRIGRDGNVGRVGRIIDFKNWYPLGELARIGRIGNTVRPRGTLLTWQKIYRVSQNRVS